MTKFLLDSGDPKEYKEIIKLARDNNSEIWGATTNPTLIAKNFAGKKFTHKEAFDLQKQIVMEILDLVPGAVSAEVYADEKTTAEEMIEQGEKIASWDKRVYVKLPTTLEAFKARTILRKKNIPINNTLVFSQQQIFAISLHEQIIRKTNPSLKNTPPQFISPFVGRLDDIGENGIQLIEHGMKIKSEFTWMLAASTRSIEHIKQSIDLGAEIITAPAKTYRQWFALCHPSGMAASHELACLTGAKRAKRVEGSGAFARLQNSKTLPTKHLKDIPLWEPPEKLQKITTIEEFMQAIETHRLDIRHPLTDTGIKRFAEDWKAILKN